jgi:hypothetical protein
MSRVGSSYPSIWDAIRTRASSSVTGHVIFDKVRARRKSVELQYIDFATDSSEKDFMLLIYTWLYNSLIHCSLAPSEFTLSETSNQCKEVKAYAEILNIRGIGNIFQHIQQILIQVNGNIIWKVHTIILGIYL